MTITKKNIKAGSDSGNRYIAVSEFKKMLPVFIAGDVILILAGILYCAVSKSFDFRIFSGIIAGSLTSAGYFLSLGLGTEEALLRKNSKKSRFSANLWYGARYLALFLVYTLLLVFNLVNVFTVATPLFFPRIYYFLTLFKKHGSSD